MTKTTITLAMLLVSIPLTSGCYFQARGVVRPPTFAVSATVPAPPRIVVTATAPTPPRVVVRATAPTPPRVVVTGGASSSASVRTAHPAPRPAATTETTVPLATGAVSVGGPSVSIVGPAQEVPTVSVSIAPPAPPATAVTWQPDPRPGYVWAGGHYDWTGITWIWRPGEWLAARPGLEWVDPRYDEGRRVYQRGYWQASASVSTSSGATRVIIPQPERPPRPQDLLPAPPISASAGLNMNFNASAHAEANLR